MQQQDRICVHYEIDSFSGASSFLLFLLRKKSMIPPIRIPIPKPAAMLLKYNPINIPENIPIMVNRKVFSAGADSSLGFRLLFSNDGCNTGAVFGRFRLCICDFLRLATSFVPFPNQILSYLIRKRKTCEADKANLL